jgi:hypothetical protein
MSKNKERKVRAKANIPEDETKEQKFIRIATPRVKQAISRMRLVKQLISSKNYSMTQEQVDNIYSLIEKELLGIRTAFDSRNKSTKKEDIEVKL